MQRAATSAEPHYRMWRQQITRASEAQERVVQAGVAFPADAEPTEVVQPGERSFHHQRTRPSPEPWSVGARSVQRRAITGFHASATARDGTCRGHSRDRRSQSENCDLVAERQGNRRAAPPRPPSGSPWPPTKRQMTPAVCRNAGETGAKSGKTRTPYRWPEARDSLQRASFRHDGRTTENRGVPGRVRISPSRLSCKYAALPRSARRAKRQETVDGPSGISD